MVSRQLVRFRSDGKLASSVSADCCLTISSSSSVRSSFLGLVERYGVVATPAASSDLGGVRLGAGGALGGGPRDAASLDLAPLGRRDEDPTLLLEELVRLARLGCTEILLGTTELLSSGLRDDALEEAEGLNAEATAALAVLERIRISEL